MALGYTMPVDGRITSAFGVRSAPTSGATTNHEGIDIAVPAGTAVKAALDGIVTAANYSSAMGNYVTIDHGNGLSSMYKHLSKFTGTIGQKVTEGQNFALSGNSGISTGAHLEFELLKNGKAIDPMSWTKEKSIAQSVGLSNIDTSGVLGVVKQYWWVIAAGLVVAAIIK